MANESVSDRVSLLNQQIVSQELLLEYFFKIEALLEVSLCDGFYNQSKSIMYNYLWLLSDLAKHGKSVNEAILDVLLKNLSQILSTP